MTGRSSRPMGAHALAALAAVLLIAGASIARADDPGAAAAAATVPFPTPAVRAWQTGLLGTDRIQHASLAMTLGLSAGLPSRSPATSFATGVLLGLVKEFWDARRDHFDWGDLAADTAGAGVSAAVTVALRD